MNDHENTLMIWLRTESWQQKEGLFVVCVQTICFHTGKRLHGLYIGEQEATAFRLDISLKKSVFLVSVWIGEIKEFKRGLERKICVEQSSPFSRANAWGESTSVPETSRDPACLKRLLRRLLLNAMELSFVFCHFIRKPSHRLSNSLAECKA